MEAVLPSFAGLPALSGLAIGDDFNAPPGNPHYRPDEVAARRQLIRRYVPGILAIGSGRGHPALPVAGYAAAMDVMGLQCYPISNTAENVPGGVPYELETCDDMFTFGEDKPDLWRELSLLTAEVAQLQDAFLSGRYVRVDNPDDPCIKGMQGAWHAHHAQLHGEVASEQARHGVDEHVERLVAELRVRAVDRAGVRGPGDSGSAARSSSRRPSRTTGHTAAATFAYPHQRNSGRVG